MTTKEDELDSLLKQQQKKDISSEDEEERDEVVSRSQFRKPIKNPFSDQSGGSDSDLEAGEIIKNVEGSPFQQKPPLPTKSALQQAKLEMKWDKNEQIQTEILSRLEGQGMKDKKIKQLAIKYKSLNIAYQKEKTLRKNFENQLNSQVKIMSETMNKSEKIEKKSTQKATISSVTCANCQQNQKKVMQFRLKNQNLKSQINKTKRVISRELGQDFNIDQVLSEENGWKGRQQKIQKLKSRVKDLEDKLNNNGIDVSRMTGFTSPQVTNSAFNGTRTSALMAENKRKQHDNLKIQVDALKSQNQILQGKVKSLVARKIILQNQIKQIKTEFEKKKELLIEKSNNDNKFIELLKNQNQRLKRDEKVVTKIIYKDDNGQVPQLKKQIQILKKKLKAYSETQQIPKKTKETLKHEDINQQTAYFVQVSKDLNSVQPPRILSADKKKRMEDQYLKSGKYLKKMSTQDEQDLYKNWKNGLNKQGN